MKHGQHVARVLQEMSGRECGFVYGESPTAQRDELLGRFRSGDLKYLANVNVLTTGFDAPNSDCVALAAPDHVAGVVLPDVWSGLPSAPGQAGLPGARLAAATCCGTGPVDQIRVREVAGNGNGQAPAKECPECHSVIAAGYAVWPGLRL